MAYREFSDPAGVVWRAWDTRPSSTSRVRARYADGWLSFECDGERRRLGPIPNGWSEADDATLREWLGQAEPVRKFAESPRAVQVMEGTSPELGSSPRGQSSEPPLGTGALLARTRTAVERARAVIATVDSVTRRLEETGEPPLIDP